MKSSVKLLLLVLVPFIFLNCKKKDDNSNSSGNRQMEVIINDIPFKTNKYLRIPFMLKTWEWKKEGLALQQINVIDDVTKAILVSLDKGQFPRIHQDPLPSNPIMPFDKINNYYFSVQVPIPLDQAPPSKISTRLVFRDTLQGVDVTIEGGVFEPKLSSIPIAIATPVKGKNWIFINQSTNDYHFYTAIFTGGKMGTGERFAFDNLQVDDNFISILSGDSTNNYSYYNYHDTLYAVADGIVAASRDTMPENNGNAHNVTFSAPIDYAGNYMIIDIGGSNYAMYAHCSKNQVFVKTGDTVKEGQPIALLGNSGNSDAPHLHFEIGDAPDFFMCNGVPFVMKHYTKIGEFTSPGPITPVEYYNVMMEETTILRFD